jgi:response regulator RpfG family c-di-GMP phosphodiesterase
MKNFTILLVDDDQNNIDSLSDLISSLFDINIVVAYSGEDALRTLLKRDVDLIMSDIQMPNMDGFEVAMLLKKRKITKDIPIVFLTAIDHSWEHKKHGYDIGIVDYITKPIDSVILEAKLKIFLKIYDLEQELNSYKTIKGK